MSIRGKAAIVGIGETPPDRLGSKPGEPRRSVQDYLATAMRLALTDARLTKKDFDGQGLGAIYSAGQSQAFWPAEVADILGLSPGLLLAGGQGGASAVSLLGQASAAIASGLIELALIVSADAPFSDPVTGSQASNTRDFEVPFGAMGPNSKIALVMRRHMHEYGTTLEQLGRIAVASRYHASLNPDAYLRAPITIDDYKNSRLIADPIRLLDCVMRTDGAAGLIMMSHKRAKEKGLSKCIIPIGYAERTNFKGGENLVDVTKSGHEVCGKKALGQAGLGIKDIASFHPYDDFIIAIMLQFEAFGFCKPGQGVSYIRDTNFAFDGDLPLNTGGGQISAGQAACSSHNLVEAVRQLRREGGKRQVKDTKNALVTGIGWINYGRNWGSSAALVLVPE